jgi:hypothetical protein
MRYREQQREVNAASPVEEIQFLSEVTTTGKNPIDRAMPWAAPAEPVPILAPAPEPTYTPPPGLKRETVDLIEKDIVPFSDVYEELKRVIPAEYFQRGHGQPFFIPSQAGNEVEWIKKGESNAKAVDDLGQYKAKGGKLTRGQQKFVYRYILVLPVRVL